MRKKISFIIFFAVILIMSINVKANASYANHDKEEILNYDIEIHVNEDASMEVKEKITVNAQGKEIKHGIYRDFPTQYKNNLVIFKVNRVTLDDENVSYSTKNIDKGVRIQIGSSADNVSYGYHTYEIDYTTEKQLFFENKYNELYWNLIGSGWSFDIEKCSAKIYFPEGTEIFEDDIKTYVGKYGNSNESEDVHYYVDEGNSAVYFNVNKNIPANNAFTVVVRVKKGTIVEPTFFQKVKWFVDDNAMYMVIFIGMICLGIWQFLTWRKYGKDPEKNIIIPKYYPPEGKSVGDVKYIDTMGKSNRILGAIILNLATKGYFKFSKTDDKNPDLIIEKTYEKNIDDPKENISPVEREVYMSINRKEVLRSSDTLYKKVQRLEKEIDNDLSQKYKNKLFFRNTNISIASIVISVIVIIIGVIAELMIKPQGNAFGTKNIFIVFVVSIIAIALCFVFKDLLKSKDNKILYVFMALVIGIPFLIMLFQVTSGVWTSIINNTFQAIVLVGLVVQNYLFIKWIPKYTEEGMGIKEDIEGFKMFINTTNDESFKEKTPEMFDKYFAYAYVLGLENKWASKFEDTLNQMDYAPMWCSASMFYNGRFDCTSFTSGFSTSFSSGMSAASSSGMISSGSFSSRGGSSRGGGFSGGGRGGRWPEVAGKKYFKGKSMKKKICFVIFLVVILIMSINVKVNASYDDSYDYYDREEILDYDIEMRVNEDATMDVKETITVNAMGEEIQHGIYRDFPTQYKNKLVTFEINKVTMDGKSVNFTTENVDRGVRIKIGSSDEYVTQGQHTYVIDYTTERQMFFEDDYNELYWNLIGSGWNFDIEQCSAKIYFPKKTDILEDEIKAYVGEYGNSKESDDVYCYVDHTNAVVYFDLYEMVPANNAFTVVVRVEKGTIDEPTFEQRLEWFLEDNVMYVVLFVGMIGLGIWQFFMWKHNGKDPEKNIIIPKYYPPEGLDVGDVRYIDTMGKTSRILEATLISLATKGFLKFTKSSEKSKTLIIEKVLKEDVYEKKDTLSENEKMVYESLGHKEILKYSEEFYKKVNKMQLRLAENLEEKYKNKLFFKNWKNVIVSIVFTVILFVIGGISGEIVNPFATEINMQNFFMVVLTAVIFGLVFVVCKALFKNKSSRFFNVIFAILWGGPFLLFGIAMAADVFSRYAEYAFQGFVLVEVCIQNYLFLKLIPKYSEDGMRIKEEIEGFEMFIKTVKDDDFADKTPEMFDKYFAYAYVLGLENAWASKFEDVLKQANYTPSWCSDYLFVSGMFDCSSFTSSFSSSISSGVSSASTAPSSSSSSGGGGFSGGGGGGRWPEVAGKKIKNLIKLALSY